MPSRNPAERDPNLVQLVEKIARERRFGFDAYKESCLRRRLAVRMRACEVNTYEAYADVLERDRAEYDKLLDALTINVTKFFRNRETWDALKNTALSALWGEGPRELRCWSAGCASGEEPYTLAILISELARQSGTRPEAVRIDATDLDGACLDRAQRGVYNESAFEEMPADLVERYFSRASPRTIDQGVRDLVVFGKHDVIKDPPPAPPYDLIICRNVLIYFDRVTQDRLISGFIAALRRDGYLVLGKSETLLGVLRTRLILENPRERIYRRP